MRLIPTSSYLTLAAVALAVAACSDDSSGASSPDAQVDSNVDSNVDAGPVTSPLCDGLGLPTRPFDEGAGGNLFGDLAADFAITELDGSTWRFSEHWSGCGSVVFIAYIPTTSPEPKYEDVFWSSSPADLLSSRYNVDYVFVSFESDAAARRARVQGMADRIDALVDGLSSAESRDRQRARLHYAVDAPLAIEGSVGALLTDYFDYLSDPASRVDLGDRGMASPPLPFLLAIDRDQRWDAGESIEPFVGGAPELRQAAFLPLFFDHKAAIRDALAAEVEQGARVETVVLLDERVSDRLFERTVTLPSAAEMAAYDRVEFDVSVTCPHRNVFACSEWDRNARIALCASGDCASRLELVRWITPYWRRGERRWLIDASALRGLLADGGEQTFFIEMGPEWERLTERDARIALRLIDSRGDGEASDASDSVDRAVGAELAFTGGAFDDTYNDREPMSFTPPLSASRVELVVILSGHGGVSGSNCAEWCDHRHGFAVNGTALETIQHRGTIGSINGCGYQAAAGVPPGQFGNWAVERAYWCPGLPVEPIRIDITDHVALGQPNELTYEGSYAGGAPAGGDIDLSSYVVWFQ